MRIIHTSDIHLGGYIGPSEDNKYEQQVLKALVDLSIQEHTDAILIAGDLFDSNRVDSAIIEIALEEFRRTEIPTIILPGNHDCLVPDSIYLRPRFAEAPKNVHILMDPEGEKVSFPDLDLAVWGKPLTDYGGDLRPLSGIPARGEERWQIAIAHGHYSDNPAGFAFSFPIDMGDIISSKRDYVALGHWGIYHCVCEEPIMACYSGCPFVTGAILTVDFTDETGVKVRSFPISI